MIRLLAACICVLMLGLGFTGDGDSRNGIEVSAQDKSTTSSDSNRSDRMAIQDSIAGYLDAINERDAMSAASFWSDNGEWVGDDGTRYRGRSEIGRQLAESFDADPPGTSVALRDVSLRFVTPNVSIEDGVAVISDAVGGQKESTYTVVHVKENGSWKIHSVRDINTPMAPTPQSALDSLSWLIGDWMDQIEGDTVVQTSCSWAPGNNALRRSISVSSNGQEVLSGTQIIRWDTQMGKIRSWLFDSDGGMATGTWNENADGSWSIDSTYQMADGSVGTSINTITPIDDSTHTYASTYRELNGVTMPDVPAFNVVRTN